MKKVLITLGACAFASLSFAQVDIFLGQEYWNVKQQSLIDITGTVNVSPGWDATTATVEHPSNGTSDLSSVVISEGLYSWLATTTSNSYSGVLFRVHTGGAEAGIYDLSSRIGTARAEMGVQARRISDGAWGSGVATFGISVQAIPEPASFVPLGLGAVALLHRRRVQR